MSMKAIKKELRKSVRSQFQQNLSQEQRSAEEAGIERFLSRWLAQVRISAGSTVLAYWPTLAEEPDFRATVVQLLHSGVRIGMPRLCWETKSLEFHAVQDPHTDLISDESGLTQPAQNLQKINVANVDAIIVPGLAFDLSGGRLGRGAGFYDRTLAGIPARIPRWAPAFSIQMLDAVPMESWDVQIDGIISPRGLINCRQS